MTSAFGGSSFLGEAGDTALSQVRTQLEKTREVGRRLAVAIYEFKDGTDSQAQVNSLLLEYSSLLTSTAESANHPALQDIAIPVSLIKHVDGGGHPDTWLQGLLHELEGTNEMVQQRHRSLSTLRVQLIEGLLGSSSTMDDFMKAALLEARGDRNEEVVEVDTV